VLVLLSTLEEVAVPVAVDDDVPLLVPVPVPEPVLLPVAVAVAVEDDVEVPVPASCTRRKCRRFCTVYGRSAGVAEAYVMTLGMRTHTCARRRLGSRA
jgi:hypothetical protein